MATNEKLIIAHLRRNWSNNPTHERSIIVQSTLTEIEANLRDAEDFRHQIAGDHSIHEANLLATSAAMYESRANTLATLLGLLIN